MPDYPLNWQTRLEITAAGVVVSPIDSFTPTFNLQTTPVHSVEADNVGAIFHPKTATFTMSLKAIGTSVAELTRLAITGGKFDIQVAEKQGTDWSFKKMLFRDCVITSANPSNVVIDGAPAATFSGIILGFTADTDQER